MCLFHFLLFEFRRVLARRWLQWGWRLFAFYVFLMQSGDIKYCANSTSIFCRCPADYCGIDEDPVMSFLQLRSSFWFLFIKVDIALRVYFFCSGAKFTTPMTCRNMLFLRCLHWVAGASSGSFGLRVAVAFSQTHASLRAINSFLFVSSFGMALPQGCGSRTKCTAAPANSSRVAGPPIIFLGISSVVFVPNLQSCLVVLCAWQMCCQIANCMFRFVLIEAETSNTSERTGHSILAAKHLALKMKRLLLECCVTSPVQVFFW